MGFLDTLKRVMGIQPPNESAGHAYDRARWRKQLTHVLNGLPASQSEWERLLSEARALNIDPEWVKGSQLEEFALMMRRAVADGVVSAMEHRKLDLARDLIGIPEAEAESILHSIVTEAETFFGKPTRGD